MDDAEDQDFHSQIYNNNVNASVVEAEQQKSINETSLFRGWQNSSRIFRVSRASGGKDRHSKVLTSKGLRDRRVRLSVSTAIQFYDLQDRLGYDQPSKAVDWLIKAAADSIAELPSLHGPFLDCTDEKLGFVRDSSPPHQQKNLSASSTSETSKGSGLSLTRSDVRVNQRVKARERARERAKEKECTESEFNQAVNAGQRRLTTPAQTGDSANHVSISTSSTFTELLTGGNQSGSSPNNSSPMMMDYFTNAGLISTAPSAAACLFLGQAQMGHNHHFSFDQHNLIQSGNDDHQYDLNFTISSSSNSPSGLAAGYNNRGTLQSNSLGSTLLHQHNLHQRYNMATASMEGSNNVPAFFMSMNNNTNQHHHFSTGVDGSLHLYYGNHKDKGKN